MEPLTKRWWLCCCLPWSPGTPVSPRGPGTPWGPGVLTPLPGSPFVPNAHKVYVITGFMFSLCLLSYRCVSDYIGDFFPSICWFLTVYIAFLPAGPGVPGRPGLPWLPFSPLSPGRPNPGRPGGPLSPGGPLKPGFPSGPRSPLMPSLAWKESK